jgi:hypothetical protein
LTQVMPVLAGTMLSFMVFGDFAEKGGRGGTGRGLQGQCA